MGHIKMEKWDKLSATERILVMDEGGNFFCDHRDLE